MATHWIKFEHTTPDKPEIVTLSTQLKIHRDAVVGKLMLIWIWADIHSIDGKNMAVTTAFLDRLTSRKGFCAALRAAGWLAGVDGALTLVNFTNHNGATAKTRSIDNRRKASQRERDKMPTKSDETSDDCPDGTGTENGTRGRGRGRGREGGGEDASPPAPPISEETTLQWLQRLESKWPQINVRKELNAAQTNRKLQSKKLERGWFEEHWLARITPVVELGQVQTAAAVAPEPEGWRQYLKDRHPGESWALSAQACTWQTLPSSYRARIPATA